MADDGAGYRTNRTQFTPNQPINSNQGQTYQPSHSNPPQPQPSWSNSPALDLVDPLLSSDDWDHSHPQHSSSAATSGRPQPQRANTSVINASPFAPLQHATSEWRPSGILPAPTRPPGWRMEPRAQDNASPRPGSGTETAPGLPPFNLATLGRNLPHDVFQQQDQAERRGEEGPLPPRFSFDPWAPLPGTQVHPRPPSSSAQGLGGTPAQLAYHDARAAVNSSGYALGPQDQVQHGWSSNPALARHKSPPPLTYHENRIAESDPRNQFRSESHYQRQPHQQQHQQQHRQQQQPHQHQTAQSPGASSVYSHAPSSAYTSSSGLWSSSQQGFRGTSATSGWSSHSEQPPSRAGSFQWGSNQPAKYSPFPSPSAGLKNMQYRSYAAYTNSAAPIGTPPPTDHYNKQTAYSSPIDPTLLLTTDPVHQAGASQAWPASLTPQLAPVPVQPPPLTPQPRTHPPSLSHNLSSRPPSHSKSRSRPSSAAAVTLPSGLPLNPARSPWAMWAGNVPADTTQDEIWAFFRAAPGPAGSTDGAGIESIHMIARSNCAFVNYLTEAHLLHAIATISGQPLRLRDKKCKPLLCRIRQREDDAKSGVGAQRMTGIHRAFVKDKDERDRDRQGKAALARPRLRPGGEGEGEVSSEAVVIESGPDEEDSQGSSSGQSSNSSLFLAHFPKRYFILKSHNVDDLDDSVRQGWWSTQAHNEYVLDQAYRTAKDGVFIFFSANKSGQWYGYARMSGPIIPPGKDKSSSSSSDEPSGLLPSDLLADSPPRTQPLNTSEAGTDSDHQQEGAAPAQGRPFRIEWIKAQRLPFARTKHVANGFNSGREVKISRDGTEVEPSSGEQMVALFESLKPPKPISRPTGPRKSSSNSTVLTSTSSALSSGPSTPAVA